jgi:hypothetical protein
MPSTTRLSEPTTSKLSELPTMVLVVILVRVTKFKVVPDSLKGLMEWRCWFGDQEVVGGWRWWGSDGEVGMTWPDNNTTNKTTRRVGREREREIC